MFMRKKLFLMAATFYCLGITAAYPQVNVQLGIGEPAYIAPAPAYVSPYPGYYDPQHRRRDYEYWRQRRLHEQGDHRPIRHDEHHDDHGHR